MLQDPQKLIANGIISPELEKLQTENSKLKFQITHLNRVGESVPFTLKVPRARKHCQYKLFYVKNSKSRRQRL